MTYFYQCHLELHDYLYFATREIGRLYETEAVLHNYALSYALGFVDNPNYGTESTTPETEYRYFCRNQVPQYCQHLSRLNDAGIYVTPAIALRHATALHTWKYADNRHHVEMQKTQKNIPSFGRAKEIAPGSQFGFFIISQQQSCNLPHWIRLGKWMSKAKLVVTQIDLPKIRSDHFFYPYPLNPLDVMPNYSIQGFDTINMPPVSLIRNVRLTGNFWTVPGFGHPLQLPAQLCYQFSS